MCSYCKIKTEIVIDNNKSHFNRNKKKIKNKHFKTIKQNCYKTVIKKRGERKEYKKKIETSIKKKKNNLTISKAFILIKEMFSIQNYKLYSPKIFKRKLIYKF